MNEKSNHKEKNKAKVKICGLSRREDIMAVNEYGADFAGFIMLFPKSHRNITPEKAAELRKLLKPGIKAVGVFVDAPVERVAQIVAQTKIDIVQLHGNEDQEYIDRLRQMADCRITKVYTVKTKEDILASNQIKADYVLLDSGKGTGKPFEWSVLAEVEDQLIHPYFLAGGLGPDNLEQAMEDFHPFAFDVNSGVETEKVKDGQKIRQVIAMIRGN